jgi:hypothetical protein
MKTIIAGSKNATNYFEVLIAVKASGFEITEIISSGAVGIDRLGEKYAIEHSIPFQRFLPDWMRFKKRAGPIRNAEMAKNADALIAIWNGSSKGTKNMIKTAQKYGLKIYVHQIKEG